MATFNLRLKSVGGQQTLTSLTSSSSLQSLRLAVSEAAGVCVDDVRLLTGFPPKPVCLDDAEVTLNSAGIRAGDTLVLQQVSKVKNARRSTSDDDGGGGGSAAPPAKQVCLDDANLVQHLSSENPGFLVRRVVDADNSCLFSAFNLTMGRAHATPMSVRQEIARVVHNNQTEYSEAVLGRNNADYCDWILIDTSWGGAIEVSVLSELYSVEICVVDTRAVVINRFGEDKDYATRILLIYDGIHYDAIMLEDAFGMATSKFSCKDQPEILDMAMELAKQANSSRQYTDVKNLTLRCLVCQKGLNSKTAAEHASLTGHTNFGEI